MVTVMPGLIFLESKRKSTGLLGGGAVLGMLRTAADEETGLFSSILVTCRIAPWSHICQSLKFIFVVMGWMLEVVRRRMKEGK